MFVKVGYSDQCIPVNKAYSISNLLPMLVMKEILRHEQKFDVARAL